MLNKKSELRIKQCSACGLYTFTGNPRGTTKWEEAESCWEDVNGRALAVEGGCTGLPEKPAALTRRDRAPSANPCFSPGGMGDMTAAIRGDMQEHGLTDLHFCSLRISLTRPWTLPAPDKTGSLPFRAAWSPVLIGAVRAC